MGRRNFKEPQLANMRVGQPVTLKSDLYENKTVYQRQDSWLWIIRSLQSILQRMTQFQ